MKTDFPLDGNQLSSESTTPPARDRPPGAITEPEDGLAGLYFGDAPEVIGQQLFACPSIVRLQRILRCHDGVSAGELQHIALCPDCVPRARTFRRLSETATRIAFDARLKELRPAMRARSARAEIAENEARLCFTLVGQDANLDVWLPQAWKCSHSIARDLRRERDLGATVEELGIMLELRLAAVASAAADPMAACARMFDAAWPLIEMVKEAATEVALIGSPLFRSFARSVGSASRIAGPRIRAMLAYACVELMARGGAVSELAVMTICEIVSGRNGDVSVFVAALFHRRSALPAELRSALAANIVNSHRLHEVTRNVVRARQAVERILADETLTTADAIERIQPHVRRFVEEMLAADEPEEALLRMIALRRFLLEISRFSPDNGVSMVAVFRAITELLVLRANTSRLSGSTFLLMKEIDVIRDTFPTVFASLTEMLYGVNGVVRQGLIACAAEGVENGRCDDAFARGAARSARENHELRKHIRWLNARMKISMAELVEARW